MSYLFNKKLVFGSLLILVLGLIFLGLKGKFVFGRAIPARGVIITLTKDGFRPSLATIQKGQTVVFKTNQGKLFWPTSDPHPVHDIYPEFDPKNPINPDKTWSFKFDKEGTFKYHDHLSPLYKGAIIVGHNNFILSAKGKDICQKLTDRGQKKACWQSLLENTLNEKGLQAGFELFRELDQIQPEACHGYAHNLGTYAFKAYSRGQKIQVEGETSYCGYGFWHGFTEGMVKAGWNLDRAVQFCNSLTASTPLLLIEAHSNCSHGIGVGLIADPPPYELWGKIQPLILPALKFCNTMIVKSGMVENCYSGVFHAIITYMNAKQYNFHFDRDNPFTLCLEQEKKYQSQCDRQIAPKLPNVFKDDLAKVYKLVRQIPDEQLFRDTFMLAFVNFTNQQMSNKDYTDFVTKCQALDLSVSDLCIPALVKSLFMTGVPEKEYLKAMEVCSSEYFSPGNQSSCFENIISYAKRLYPDSKIEEICRVIEIRYHKICTS